MQARDFTYAPDPAPLTYLYSDQEFLIVEKPAGLLSVPGKSEPDCLEARVKSDFPNALTIHRLDMATSGLMVFARTKRAQRHIGLQFEKRYIEKSYIADIWGQPENTTGEIDLPLRCDWPHRPRQMVCFAHGKPAQTRWEVISDSPVINRVKLFPKTGRSHQLRVHMLTLGHPIIGDRLYAPEAAFRAGQRLHLHAHSLRLRHPVGGDWHDFISECPF